MQQLRVIPEFVFGVLQYVLGALLIAAPFVFDFVDDSGATVTSLVLGIIALLLALTMHGPASAADVFSPVVSEVYGFALGIVLILFPFVFDHAGDEVGGVAAYVFGGLVWFAITLATYFPRKQRVHVDEQSAQAKVDSDTVAQEADHADEAPAHEDPPPTSSQTPGMEP